LYNKVDTNLNFVEREREVLAFWTAHDIAQKAIDQREGCDTFTFYDGPPTANGKPHIGHVLTRVIKDMLPRYQSMKGKKVLRKAGWDTHGLPVELEVEKAIGINGKEQIEAYGIEPFIKKCRESVWKYKGMWEEFSDVVGFWADMEHPYITYENDFIESEWWALKEIWKKGLLYKGHKVIPYCPRCGTPLSSHEVAQGYKDVKERSAIVKFKAKDEDAYFLAWTTTPWTLPSNLGLCVNPEVEYVKIRVGGTVYYLAAALVDAVFEGVDGEREVLATFKGRDLEYRDYEPLYPYAVGKINKKAFFVVCDDYVTTEDGTGIVHQAPAYGEDDQKVCESYDIPVVLSVDEGAKFIPLFEQPSPSGSTALAGIAGVQVFEANRTIINALKADGALIVEKSYVHSYPHCWRCRNPLIYRAITSWYVKVTEFKDRMSELNEQINWIPENVKYGQFGKWVENARDWSISRNRFWGSPIPVWVSDDPNYPRVDVYGSLEELKADFGRLPLNKEGKPDLHRPYIDELTRPNPDDPTGKSTMRRVEDVLDVWFDSGSMPYAQVHYPFENKDWFENHYPADFIVEYIGQTRGWFYTLHILATALFDRPAFKNVVSHGIVLGSDGQKMSKSLRNYPDVSEVLDRDGSDAMRWFLMSSPILRGGNLIVTEQGIREGVRQVMLPLWNVYHFFALYANAANKGAGYTAQVKYDSQHVMDRFILGKTRELVQQVTADMDSYDIWSACEHLRLYADALTNWYVRRSRERFFDEDPDAFDTLYTALVTVSKVAASLLPLTTEEIYRGLTGERSVHLADWPIAEDFADESELLSLMETVRAVCSVGSSLRKEKKIRVRQPLQSLTAAIANEQFAQLETAFGAKGADYFAKIVKDELNLREVILVNAQDANPADYGISQQLKVNARAAGPRLGKQVQTAIKASKSGDWTIAEDGTVTVAFDTIDGGLALVDGEYELVTVVASSDDGTEREAAAVLPGGFLVLNIELTDELVAEGIARDTIRAIQQARKDAGLNVSDRINLTVSAPQDTLEALRAHEELVTGETLAVSLDLTEGESLTITVAKAA